MRVCVCVCMCACVRVCGRGAGQGTLSKDKIFLRFTFLSDANVVVIRACENKTVRKTTVWVTWDLI